MINKLEQTWNKYGGWAFLAFALIIYIITLSINKEIGVESFRIFLEITWEVLPILFIIFIFLFFFNIFLNHKNILKFIGYKSGIKGWVLAIIGGTLASGPMYMWYPLLEDLRKKGMRDSLAVTFLYNWGVKLPLLPMMIFYFGAWFTALITFFMVVFSIINGFIIEKILNRIKA